MVLVTAKNGLSGTFIPKRLTATYTITSATAPRRMPAATGPAAEPPPPDRAGLRQERHQGRDDQDGLEPLAHEQHERLREEVRARAAVGDQPLGALEARQQAGVNRVELVASRTPSRPRAQAGERV